MLRVQGWLPPVGLHLLLRGLLCIALAMAAAGHLYRQRSLRPGSWQRVAAAAPVLLAFLLPPLLFSPATEMLAVLAALNFQWPGNGMVSLAVPVLEKAASNTVPVNYLPLVAAGC